MIVIGDHVIDASLRLKCRQRERYGLRPIVHMAQQRGARWSSVPLGSPGGVDGPFLEGGDTLLNGREIYVGISGCASILRSRLAAGAARRQIPRARRGDEVERASPRLRHGADQARPAGLLPEKLIDGLPMSLRDWDKVASRSTRGESAGHRRPGPGEGRVIIDADNARVIEELRRRKIDVIPLPFDGPIGTRRRPALRPPSVVAGERARLTAVRPAPRRRCRKHRHLRGERLLERRARLAAP